MRIDHPAGAGRFKTGLAAAGAVTMGTGLLAHGTRVSAQQTGSGGSLTSGDVAILQFTDAGRWPSRDTVSPPLLRYAGSPSRSVPAFRWDRAIGAQS